MGREELDVLILSVRGPFEAAETADPESDIGLAARLGGIVTRPQRALAHQTRGR